MTNKEIKTYNVRITGCFSWDGQIEARDEQHAFELAIELLQEDGDMDSYDEPEIEEVSSDGR